MIIAQDDGQTAATLHDVPTGLYIGGVFREATAGRRFAVVDPATGTELASVADADEADARAALDAAVEAAPAWAAVPARQRGEILSRAFDMLMDRHDEFAHTMSLEMGKPLAEAHDEVTHGGEFLRWFSEEAPRIVGRIAPTRRAPGRPSSATGRSDPACSSRGGTSHWPWPPARSLRLSPPGARS